VSKRVASKANAQDLAAEIIRRVRAGTADSGGPGALPYVVHLSEPPTAQERLQLAACRLMQQPIVIVPGKCLTSEEWVKKYGDQGSADRQ
jgi:hypothetical protein